MNDITESFPQTRQDLSNLKQTAVDAAKDLGSTAKTHAKTAQNNLQDLASHAKEEGSDQIDHARVSLSELGEKARDYIAARPLAAIGAALVVGFFLGLSRRGSSRD